MSDSRSSSDAAEGVMSVVTPHVKSGRQAEFVSAVQEAERSLEKIEGFRGLRLIPPAQDGEPHVVVFHFTDAAGLARWEASEERRDHLERIDAFTEIPSRERKLTGLEFWFQKPGAASVPPKRSKMVLVTIAVIYPTSSALAWLLNPVLEGLPHWAGGLTMTTVMVLLLTYAIMPATVHALRRWLY